jgi:hypothetical protein
VKHKNYCEGLGNHVTEAFELGFFLLQSIHNDHSQGSHGDAWMVTEQYMSYQDDLQYLTDPDRFVG